MKSDDNPMNPKSCVPSNRDPVRLRLAQRCSATSKRTRQPCKAPAVRGWSVCRCHGARGGAPLGRQHGRYRTGRRTREATAYRRQLSELIRAARETMAALAPG